jgi:hypothetical protein
MGTFAKFFSENEIEFTGNIEDIIERFKKDHYLFKQF